MSKRVTLIIEFTSIEAMKNWFMAATHTGTLPDECEIRPTDALDPGVGDRALPNQFIVRRKEN